MDTTPATITDADAPVFDQPMFGQPEGAPAEGTTPTPAEGTPAPEANADAPEASAELEDDEPEDESPSLNKRLTSKHHRGREVHILETTAVVKFDRRGRCLGIVRYSGQHYLKEPKEIGENILAACKRHPDFFTVKPDPAALAAGEVDGNGPNISNPDEGTDKGNNKNLQAEVERPPVDPAQSTNPNALADRARLIARRDKEAAEEKEKPKDEQAASATGNIMPGMVAAADDASKASAQPAEIQPPKDARNAGNTRGK